MRRFALTATAVFLTVVGITLVGCGDASPAQSSKEVGGNRSPRTATPATDTEPSQSYVTCRATLTGFEDDYRWSDHSGLGQDDGVAPLASLVLAEPSMYADRRLGLLFKYSGNAAAVSPPDKADIGREFSIQLPADFLEGDSNVIDNLSVGHFRRLEPSSGQRTVSDE